MSAVGYVLLTRLQCAIAIQRAMDDKKMPRFDEQQDRTRWQFHRWIFRLSAETCKSAKELTHGPQCEIRITREN